MVSGDAPTVLQKLGATEGRGGNGLWVGAGEGEGLGARVEVGVGVTGVAVGEAAAICSLVAGGDGATVGVTMMLADAVQPSIAKNTALIKR